MRLARFVGNPTAPVVGPLPSITGTTSAGADPHHLRRGVLACALWVIITFAAGVLPSSAAVFISGRVFVRATHAPVAGATVSLYPLNDFQPSDTSLSLQNGAFVLKAPTPGKYRLTVDGKECRPTQLVINVPAAGIPSLGVDVVQDAPLKVRLIGPDGKPATTGEAELWGSLWWGRGGGAISPVTARPAADGTIQAPAPRGAPLDAVSDIVISVRDSAVGCGQTHLGRWPDAPVTLYLQRGATLSGVVLTAAGDPAPGVSVTISRVAASTREPMPGLGGENLPMPFRGPPFQELLQQVIPLPRDRVVTNTGDNGRFEVPALFFSEYTVIAQIPGIGARSRVVTLSSAATTVSIGPGDQVWPPRPAFPFQRGPWGGPQRPAPGFGSPFHPIPRFVPPPAIGPPGIQRPFPFQLRPRQRGGPPVPRVPRSPDNANAPQTASYSGGPAPNRSSIRHPVSLKAFRG